MNSFEALEYINSLSPSTIRLGLDRVEEALTLLKSPETTYPALHVAGTNGKGSTCAFAASCLRAQGYRVGLYTSPHLVRVNERVQINGAPISDDALAEMVDRLVTTIPQRLDLTYFEFLTVLALQHFAEQKVDIAVVETGMGGRLDATNATRPAVTAITPVSFDHMEFLGNTLTAIATEKAGIIKPNVPVVVGRQEPEALEAIETIARERGAKVFQLGQEFDFEPGADGSWIYRGMRTRVSGLRLRLNGRHQVDNAAVACASLELLEDRGLRISRENARIGFATARWPGRLEEFPGAPLVVLDGAHNRHGAEALAKALSDIYSGRSIHLVFGVLADKEWRLMLKALVPKATSVYLTKVDSPRGLDPAACVDEVMKLGRRSEVFASAEEALETAKKAAGDRGLVVVCGSLILLGQVRALLERSG